MSLSSRVLLPVLGSLLALGAALLLTSSGRQERDDPYQVVITRPLKFPGWRANELYRIDPLMTEAFNALEKEKLTPIYFQVFESGRQGDYTESRAMIVCKKK